ncbi:MAG: glycosyl hydrolase 53 family protein, partial [Bacteroidaceae bacterium]
MKTRNFIPILLLFLAIASCGGEDFIPPHTPPDTTPTDSILEPDTTQQDTLPDVEPEDFARGADISWYTQMEDKGKKFYSWNHREPMECPSVMQDLGLNAIALRVLVTPSDGYCDIPDVLHKSLRVKQLDVDLLLSLHYSDTIASTSLQRTPVEWQEHDINMLVEDVQEHTSSVLQALTAENIYPRWIQIGNQLSQGLLWPEGDITRHAAQYARLVNAACSAARIACPQAQIIVAAGNPLHQPALCAALDALRTTLYDQIGLTLYPTLSVGTIFQPISVTASSTVQNEYDAIAY